jgi:H+-transporting ATPase
MKPITSPVQNPLKEIANPDVGALFRELSSSPEGLTVSEAKKRLGKYGYNELPKKSESPLKFSSHFWNPILCLPHVARFYGSARNLSG